MLNHQPSVFEKLQRVDDLIDRRVDVKRPVEPLPFRVRVVRDEEDLEKAIQVRHSAYARHMPELAQTLKLPEAADTQLGVAILLAESKLDGSPLGTVRIQANTHHALTLEKSVRLPAWLQGQTLAHVSRLAIAQGSAGRVIKTMLFKGLFRYWELQGIDWAVVAARKPLDRTYEQLLFDDVFPGEGFIPLAHMNQIPHRVMAFEVATAEERWTVSRHPLTNFVFHTHHPDLDVSGPSLQDSLAKAAASRTSTDRSVSAHLVST